MMWLERDILELKAPKQKKRKAVVFVISSWRIITVRQDREKKSRDILIPPSYKLMLFQTLQHKLISWAYRCLKKRYNDLRLNLSRPRRRAKPHSLKSWFVAHEIKINQTPFLVAKSPFLSLTSSLAASTLYSTALLSLPNPPPP